MGIDVKEARITDCAPMLADLIRENWAETGFGFELNIDFPRYQSLQDAGAVIAIAAFDGYKIVGYSTAVISGHLYNPAAVCCASDALFVRKEYRNGSTGLRLIRATEKLASERGARMMLWHTRAGTSLAKILKKRGYIPADVVVMKELGNGS
jgi:GNAT superfamily N-acetyltransferase